MNKEKLFSTLITLLISTLSPDMLKKMVDMFLDFIEDAVTDSENKWDDIAILPLCNLVRTAFNVPDDD